MSYVTRFNEKVCLQLWGGDALRMLTCIYNVFEAAPQKLWDFHGGSSVGQVQSLKSWGQNPSRSFWVRRK